jgi:predicted signal transduction protein with EAL and GGDEF domain
MTMPRRPLRNRPLVGVLVIVVALLALSAFAWAGGLAGGAAVTGPQLAWWVLLPLFLLVEATVLHIQVKREAQAVSLNEIPLVLALFLSAPVGMLAAAVLGGALVYLARRQTLVKVSFNTAVRVFGVTLALVVFHALVGQAPALGPGAWLAALTAVTTTGVVDGMLVLAVVALYEGDLDGHDLARELLATPPVAAVVGTVGLTAVVMLHADSLNAILLVALGVAVFAGYRTYASLHDRHISLARLYDFGRAVNDAHQIHEVLTSVLTGARELLKAEAAELVLITPGADPAAARRWVLAEGSPVVVEVAADGPVTADVPGQDPVLPGVWTSALAGHVPLLLPRRRGTRGAHPQLHGTGYREAVIVPVLDEAGILGHLVVAERMGQVRTFHPSDIPLLETVANQAGLALRNSRLMERLRREALHDSLTGLANRAMLRQALTDAMADVTTGTSPGLAILLLDLDGFKEVNDSLGHHSGDLLLTHVAAQLTLVTEPDPHRGTTCESAGADHDPITPRGTVARLGGDEFAVLLRGVVGTDEPLAVAARIHAAIGVPITLEGVEVTVRASIGIARPPTRGCDPALVMRRADEAMYTAKNSGGGTHLHPDDQQLDQLGQTPMALLAELRRAIESQQITLHVQPQAHTGTGKVYGAEALVRWDHPSLGLLPPTEFLALADRHALMHDLTATVLDQAGLDLTISVNLSARTLTDPRLVPAVEAALRRHRLPPSYLTLEITEDCVINDPDRAITLLNALRATGVRLSVDDFGTGYSSLSYLRHLPVHEVKIDRSFIATLTTDPDSRVIVRAITDLGTNLGLHVIAEGVEDQPSWDHLAGLGCHAIQGYQLAEPMPPDHLPPWLHGYRTHETHPTQAATVAAPPRPRLHAI